MDSMGTLDVAEVGDWLRDQGFSDEVIDSFAGEPQ